MEEKKPVKISLSTVLLIVALVIIIFLCIYIFRLSSKIDTLSDNKNSISNSLNETDTVDSKTETTISTNTDTLPQLPGNFSDIKSITKEYRDNQNVKNYKDFKYDIDSDGIIDKITLKQSFLIGISQSFALIPGFSRSGTTILTGRLLESELSDISSIFFGSFVS